MKWEHKTNIIFICKLFVSMLHVAEIVVYWLWGMMVGNSSPHCENQLFQAPIPHH